MCSPRMMLLCISCPISKFPLEIKIFTLAGSHFLKATVGCTECMVTMTVVTGEDNGDGCSYNLIVACGQSFNILYIMQ